MVKAIYLSSEYCHLWFLKQDQSLDIFEIQWMNQFIHVVAPLLQLGKKSYIPKWDIRKMKEEFSEWLKQLGTHSLFFDGALWNNHGVAGAGVSLFYPRGNIVTLYSWGLGATSNNTIESYTLFLRLSLARERNIIKLAVFRDSMIMIKAIINRSQFGTNLFNAIISRVIALSQ